MRQMGMDKQRVLDALLVQVRERDEKRFSEICAFFEKNVAYPRSCLNWPLNPLTKKDWDGDYSIQRWIDYSWKSISKLNKRVIDLERREDFRDEDREWKDHAFDEGKIDLFLSGIRNEIVQTEARKKKERLRMAVFTPLSPLKNGIADYMTEILLALKQYAEIDIYIDEGYEPDNPDIMKSFAVYRHKRFHELHDRYDLVLYELGNNPHHAYIIPYAFQYPGILELHDLQLRGLYRSLSPEYQELARTESVCARYPKGCDENPLSISLLKASRGVLIHSEFSRQAVLDQDIPIAVRKIEHFAKAILEKQEADQLVKKHRLEDCFLFSCFGFVNFTKRVEQIVISFSNIVQKYPKAKFKLLIVGEVAEDYLASIRVQIRKRHLKKHVVMTGYVTLSDMYKYISLTDVCMNLRNPYGGESSGTLSRIMGMGKACVVNRVGAFDEMPDFCCHKIAYENNPEKEIENITDAMSILFENSAYRKWIAENAQIYVMKHLNLNRTIQLYCESLNHFYCSPTFDIDRLMERASAFLAYNYFEDPYYAAIYLTSRLYPFIYGGAEGGQ